MSKKAILYRMVTKEHICPFGLRSKDLLEREGFEVEDHKLTSREQADVFKAKHEVKTTPQTFINGERVGGYDALTERFQKGDRPQSGVTYTPVIAIFSVSAILALVMQMTSFTEGFASLVASIFSLRTVMLFIAVAMVLLSVQKLKDLYAFTNSFITYDLLAMHQLRYGYAYPFLEAYVGLTMIASWPALLVAPVSIFIGTVGAISVIKAVYIDRRELKCACVGGDSNVPLGFVSLSENLFMVLGGLLMFYM